TALTDEERRRVAEVVVETADRRVPVVIGVSGASAHHAAGFARHARKIGADAVIAMLRRAAPGSVYLGAAPAAPGADRVARRRLGAGDHRPVRRASRGGNLASPPDLRRRRRGRRPRPGALPAPEARLPARGAEQGLLLQGCPTRRPAPAPLCVVSIHRV